MFGMDITVIAIMGLAAFAIGGIIFAVMFNRISAEANQARRFNNIKERDQFKASKAAARIQDAAKRRKTVQDSLKELEEKQKAKHGTKVTLKKMIEQSGLPITQSQFFILSAVFGVLCGFAALFSGFNFIVILGAMFVGGLGVPRWFVSFTRKRRFKAFLEEFPNAIDVIVRGVKAGLPLNDCLGIIAREAKDPVKSEFARIVESQKMGLTMGEAIGKLYQNMPLAEANFFGIVVAIQESAGGNLSEALSNLSNVLRDRKKLQNKIKAVSSEAKASAGIIGSLPMCVSILIYLTTPDYISLLFTHSTGHLILGASAIWMSMGILVMKNMINFDF
ncbi:MAG: type II secretion system F family protein [Nitratireductor sp.]|nr:type II secretion system F family protein [Nitratireductor sp.]